LSYDIERKFNEFGQCSWAELFVLCHRLILLLIYLAADIFRCWTSPSFPSYPHLALSKSWHTDHEELGLGPSQIRMLLLSYFLPISSHTLLSN
jgi:hypothetical protein